MSALQVWESPAADGCYEIRETGNGSVLRGRTAGALKVDLDNAQLWAAAPELYAACLEAVGVIGLPIHPDDAAKIRAQCAAALSKARGETP